VHLVGSIIQVDSWSSLLSSASIVFFNCHLLLRLPCVSNLSAIFCNSCSIFLLSFCSQLSLLYPPDFIFPIISYLPVLIFLFPFCTLSSASCCLTNLREDPHYVRIFTVFGPLLSSSEYNFVFISPPFYIRIVTISTFFRLFVFYLHVMTGHTADVFLF
jgi:hypothetical protein